MSHPTPPLFLNRSLQYADPAIHAAISREFRREEDGLELIAQLRLIYDNYNYQTEILAASIRHTMHLIKCAEIGADVATCPLNVITGLLKHPLTDSGLEKFLADHKKANG